MAATSLSLSPAPAEDAPKTPYYTPSARLLTLAEARAQLRLGATKVAELVATGQLASIKVGRRRLIPADAITAFVSERLAAGGGRVA